MVSFQQLVEITNIQMACFPLFIKTGVPVTTAKEF
jgi:hypothetical protein